MLAGGLYIVYFGWWITIYSIIIMLFDFSPKLKGVASLSNYH
jgi:hypothetical protein